MKNAGATPNLFTDRVIIFGCLSDFNNLPPMKSESEPLPDKIRKVATEARDYLTIFRFGHFMWIGPGSEKVWQYDKRNPPLRWQPRADEFMSIIKEVGHPIYTGAVPSPKVSS